MAGSYFRSTRVLVLAALSVASAIADRLDRWATAVSFALESAWNYGWDWVTDRLVRLVDKLPRTARMWAVQLPQRLVAMRDYFERQVRLQRPRKFPQWSLTPST